MPHWAAASPRGRPSSTSAIASIRRAAFASRVRAAFRRRSAADSSVRVIATAIPASRIHVREKRIIPTSARGITGESTIRALGITTPDYDFRDASNPDLYLEPYRHYIDHPFMGNVIAPGFPGFSPADMNQILRFANQGVNIVRT